MGSVSSVVNGNDLNSKPYKASQYRLKEGTNHHRKSGGCSLDELLTCGFTQSSSSSTHPSKGLSHSRSGRSEDFFYIKVNHKPRSVYQRERSIEDQVSRSGDSDRRQQSKLLYMPGKITGTTSTEKLLVHSTDSSSVNPMRISSTETGHHSLDHILFPLRKTTSPKVGRKKDALGTLSDSGRNSLSSLPTYSTGATLTACTAPISHDEGRSTPTSRGQQANFPPWVNRSNTKLNYSCRLGLNGPGLPTKTNEDDGSTQSAEEPNTLPNTVGGIRSPITTDEFTIEHLEQRLLERETELQDLQVSHEEKEADTCQLLKERQRLCAEEVEGLKQRCSSKLQQASQTVVLTHQALQLQVNQLQVENEKLQDEVSRLNHEKDHVELRLRSYEKESIRLSPTLEESQWEVCQKTGEISLLKQQLRECQADVNLKLNEIISLRALLRENTAKMETLEKQNKDYEGKIHSSNIEYEVCQNELQCKKNEADFLRQKVIKLEKRSEGMKQDSSVDNDQRLKLDVEHKACTQTENSRSVPNLELTDQVRELECREHLHTGSIQQEVEKLRQQLKEEKKSQERLTSSFEQERQTWNKEKDRVIKYQKQLQINYLQVNKKNQDLERIVKELTAELESRPELRLNMAYSSGLQTYDDVIATEI